MKYADINKRYTEIVAEYIAKGYTINTASMSGSQGERAHVDLTDGKEIIRVVLVGFHIWKGCDLEGFKIIAGRCTDSVKPNDHRDWNATIWNDNLNVHHMEIFYAIGRTNNAADYYGTIEEAEQAYKIRLERYTRRNTVTRYTPNAKAMEIAVRIVRDKLGYKRINAADVKLDKYKGKYAVSYRGKTYTLR